MRKFFPCLKDALVDDNFTVARVLFRHTCAGCSRRVEVEIDIDALTVQQSVCIYCSYRQFYDNRQGRLREIYHQQVLVHKKTASFVKQSSKASSSQSDFRIVASTPEAATKELLPKKTKNYLEKVFKKKKNIEKLRQHRFRWFYLGITTAITIFLIPVVLWVWIASYPAGNFYPMMQKLSGEIPNRIFDRNGIEVAQLLRQPTGYLTRKQIPLRLEEFLLHVEDRNFWNHDGIDYFAMLRAALKNLFQWRFVQGGSTLTQQLARILMGEREKVITRKIKEIAFAKYLEQKLTKDEIFTHYINRVYLGHGAWGFSSAANFYFRKELSQCNDTELLILVALPPAPERYSPLRNLSLLEQRLDAIYESLPEKYKKVFSRTVFENQKKDIFRNMNRSPAESVFGERLNHLPWLSEYVRRFIQEKLGEEFTYDAGLRIETTVDMSFMEHASDISYEQVSLLRSSFPPVRKQNGVTITTPRTIVEMRRRYQEISPLLSIWGFEEFSEKNPELQTASVGLLNGSGEIIFFVGGTQFKATNQLNRAFQMRRQTGSAIKPFIYAGAIAYGLIYPGTIIEDSPVFFDQRNNPDFKKGYWLPQNVSGVYEGEISVRRALVASKNTVAVRVGYLLGNERLADIFRSFFFYKESEFKIRFRSDASIAIGSLEMSPLEMALGFSAFANNGEIFRPWLINKIVDQEGKMLYSHESKDEFLTGLPPRKQALSGDVAQVMASMLADSAAAAHIHGNVIGKTGTTNESRDAWFIGATPDITTAVWVGYDDASYSMAGGLSAAIAAPLWNRIMKKAPRQKNQFVFSPQAQKVTICPLSGYLASSYCKVTHQEIATEKSQPQKICDRHQAETSALKSQQDELRDFW